MQRGLVALGALAVVLALGGVICTPLADTGPASEALLVGSLEFGPSAADGTLRSSNQAAGQVLESTQLDRSDAVANRHQIVYTLGGRRPGDRLVGLSSDSKFWSTAQDVKLDLQYPQAGVGAVVTYVEVTVDQSSQAGTGYVVAGGIGQRFVRLVIEAYGTQHFTYTAAIYGV
ncbi:uncharacterized protein LOC131213952 [Anopheles bellator]|uniref:uncharacterized protein LOC131213952 n=1 Tax=Anopheles bellator TaxID=139047 RepID=UPI0026495615|nr:uncharacterized protein LOC131213952 [Anopheles bellator]